MAVKEIFATKQGCASYPVAELVRGDSNTTLIRLIVRNDQAGVDLDGLKWTVNAVNPLGVLESVHVEMVAANGLICGEWLVGSMAAIAVGRTVFQVEGVNTEGARVWQSGRYHIDVGERVDGEAGEDVPERLMSLQELIEYVNSKLPEVLAAGHMAEEAGETAKAAYQHPPIIGENGNWLVWDWETAKYADTGKPSQGAGGSGGTVIGGVSSLEGLTGDLTLDDVGAARKFEVGEGLKMADGVLSAASHMPEFVGTIVADGASEFVILDRDANGNAFALTRASVMITFSDEAPPSQVYLGVAPYKWVSYSGSSMMRKYMRVDITPIGAGLWTGCTTWSNALIESGSNVYSVQLCDSGSDRIDRVALYIPSKVPDGTVIKLYGVKANA